MTKAIGKNHVIGFIIGLLITGLIGSMFFIFPVFGNGLFGTAFKFNNTEGAKVAYYVVPDNTDLNNPGIVIGEFIDYYWRGGSSTPFYSLQIGDVYFPENYGFKVIGIKSLTFKSEPYLRALAFNKFIKYIPMDTVFNCQNLETVVIPETVLDIDIDAFGNCNNLKYIVGTKGSAAEAFVEAYNADIDNFNRSKHAVIFDLYRTPLTFIDENDVDEINGMGELILISIPEETEEETEAETEAETSGTDDPSTTSAPDSGTDAPSDTTPDSGTDAPSDTKPDSGTHAPSDTTHDSGTDAPSETTPDSGTDAPSDTTPEPSTTTTPESDSDDTNGEMSFPDSSNAGNLSVTVPSNDSSGATTSGSGTDDTSGSPDEQPPTFW